jgi:hypothetical protein
MEELVQHGSLEDIERNIDSLDTLELTRLAARYARLDVLEYLKSKNVRWSEFTFNYTIYECHVDVLIWLKNNILPYTTKDIGQRCVCVNASIMGRLDILLWAIENGFHYNSEACFTLAMHYENMNVAEYIHNNYEGICIEGKCKLCSKKMEIVRKLAETQSDKMEDGTYIDWLSNNLVNCLIN